MGGWGIDVNLQYGGLMRRRGHFKDAGKARESDFWLRELISLFTFYSDISSGATVSDYVIFCQSNYSWSGCFRSAIVTVIYYGTDFIHGSLRDRGTIFKMADVPFSRTLF